MGMVIRCLTWLRILQKRETKVVFLLNAPTDLSGLKNRTEQRPPIACSYDIISDGSTKWLTGAPNKTTSSLTRLSED